MTYCLLLLSLGIILAAAEIFTNGIEWLGLRMHLADGAIGSILAAVGTALPESLIPLIAFMAGRGADQQQIGVGAIIGAPFMLSTLAFFISGFVVVMEARKRPGFPYLQLDGSLIQRDLIFFFIGYSIGIGAAISHDLLVKRICALILLVWYAVYVILTLRKGKSSGHTSDLRPLFFSISKRTPRMLLILLQVVTALVILVGGAQLFIKNVTIISEDLGIPLFFLSLIVAPIATELPEKFNSVIWLIRKKDTLAIGNITGAMVFQSAILPCIAIFCSNWQFVEASMAPLVLTYASAGLVLLSLLIGKKLNAYVLLCGALFYIIFLWSIFH